MVVVLLAEGFEEIEALTPADLLRRAGLSVIMAGVGGKEITGSHGIKVTADAPAEKIAPETIDALVLPGGLKGTMNLEASQTVQCLIDSCVSHGKILAAICAAPSILAHKGLLKGKNATAFPNFQKDLLEGGAVLSEEYVCKDGQFVTARGMGVSTQFGLKLCEILVSPEKAKELQDTIQWKA